MTISTEFAWPKALLRLKSAAEDGTLEPRTLFPVEVKALIELVAGAPVDESPRAIAPEMTVRRRDEERDIDTTGKKKRTAFFFTARFPNDRVVWQCSLFTKWRWHLETGRQYAAATALVPRNIVHAVTRSVQS